MTRQASSCCANFKSRPAASLQASDKLRVLELSVDCLLFGLKFVRRMEFLDVHFSLSWAAVLSTYGQQHHARENKNRTEDHDGRERFL